MRIPKTGSNSLIHFLKDIGFEYCNVPWDPKCWSNGYFHDMGKCMAKYNPDVPYKEYTTFTVVRNPYDRFISGYFMMLRRMKLTPENLSIDTFIDYMRMPVFCSDVYWHCFITQFQHVTGGDKGRLPTYIYKLENVKSSDSKELGFQLSEAYSNYVSNQDKRDKMSHYTDKVIQFCNSHFSVDFREFGYIKN